MDVLGVFYSTGFRLFLPCSDSSTDSTHAARRRGRGGRPVLAVWSWTEPRWRHFGAGGGLRRAGERGGDHVRVWCQRHTKNTNTASIG
jgi:hypothetical protein